VGSHLQNQRAAVKMLHDRIAVLVRYVSDVVAGQAQKDHTALRALNALVASLPASESNEFREEFETVGIFLHSFLDVQNRLK
jgi:COP9 signalosome complex subunit 6